MAKTFSPPLIYKQMASVIRAPAQVAPLGRFITNGAVPIFNAAGASAGADLAAGVLLYDMGKNVFGKLEENDTILRKVKQIVSATEYRVGYVKIGAGADANLARLF